MSKKSKQKKKKSRDDGLQLIERAEKRLAKALAKADEAREKVVRRERYLAELIARYRPEQASAEHVADAIPLAAPAGDMSDNGGTDFDLEVSAVVPPDGRDRLEAQSTSDSAVAHEPGQ